MCPRILLITLLIFSSHFPQKGWYVQYPNIFNDIHMSSGMIGYACGGYSAIAKTTDGGESWRGLYSGVTVTNSSMFNSVYFRDIATGWVAGSFNTILKTTNGGETWSHQNSGLTPGVNESIVFNDIYFSDLQNGFCVGYKGSGSNFTGIVLRTTDGGDTWTYQSLGIILKSVSFVSASEGWIAGSQGKIYHTTDGGLNWTPQTSGTTTNLFVIKFYNANIGICGGIGRILNTIDGGATWTSRLSDVSDQFVGLEVSDGGICFAVSYSNLYYSTNFGDNWTLRKSLMDQRPYSIRMITNNNGLIAGWNGIWITSDGGVNWNAKMPQNGVECLFVLDVPRKGWAAGNSGDVARSDDGKVWKYIRTGIDINIKSIYFKDALNGWAAGYSMSNNNRMIKTTDGGETWSVQSVPTTNLLYSVFFADNSTGYAVGFGGAILKTLDGGNTWGLQNSQSGAVLKTVFFTSADVGYAGGGGAILKTTNGGLLWNALNTGITGDDITKIICLNSEVILGTTYGGKVIKSADGGNTWNVLASFTNTTIYDLDFVNEQTGWIATNLQILRSSNGGTGYLPQLSSSLEKPVSAITMLNESSGWAILGGNIICTENGGLSSSKGQQAEISPLPQKAALLQNYPNPFNPSTIINYQLPNINDQGKVVGVTLKVYDMLGKEVATLVDEYIAPGEYKIEFNSGALPSGVYFYCLRAGEFMETRKMILIR